MKLLKLGVVLVLVIVGVIAALTSTSYMENKEDSNDKLIFESMFKEEECREDGGDII